VPPCGAICAVANVATHKHAAIPERIKRACIMVLLSRFTEG
jgi:hypothetical protein